MGLFDWITVRPYTGGTGDQPTPYVLGDTQSGAAATTTPAPDTAGPGEIAPEPSVGWFGGVTNFIFGKGTSETVTSTVAEVGQTIRWGVVALVIITIVLVAANLKRLLK